MKYIALLFVCVTVFYLYSLRFRNPHKFIYYFGKKGAGKSTLMISQMLRLKRRGWTIYTNMSDIAIPGVRVFSVPDLMTQTPDKHSAVFIDEGTTDFDNRNYKYFSSGYQDWFKYQRKYKCRVYINSQAYDIDKKLRGLVDEMALCTNVCNVFCLVRPIIKTVKLTDPMGDSESRIAEGLRFGGFLTWRLLYLPRYFRYFDSYAAPARDPLAYKEFSALDELKIVTLALNRK